MERRVPHREESQRREELELGPVIGRVEEGARLTEAELDRLWRACARRPESADWMLCFAHALVNNDRPEEALGVLDRAAALRPGEILVLLAQARALAALERFAQAESLLNQVLAKHPSHADALRAFGLLRLRAGAPGEALRLARRALESDPLDEEARQIAAEAEAATAADAPASAPPSFEAELARALGARGLAARVDAGSGIASIALGEGQVARLSLAGLRAAAQSDPRGAARHLEDLAKAVARLEPPGRTPGLARVRARIFPVLRPTSFLGASGPALGCGAPAGLRWLFALDDPELVAYLSPDAARRWGVEPEAILALALENLERAPVAPSRYRAARGGLTLAPEGAWDLLAFDAGDGYDASRLLSPVHRALLPGEGSKIFAVAIPTRGCALLAPFERPEAVALLRAVARAQAEAPEGLSPELFRLGEDGELSSIEPIARPAPVCRSTTPPPASPPPPSRRT
jgi:tetratricopeptide (TPR) repeat protein